MNPVVSKELESVAQDLDSGQSSGAGRWILISRIAAQLSQISLFLLAARFLTPAEFGVFALIQAFSALLFVGAAAGWREAIISTAKSRHEINQLMAFSLLSGVAMAAIGGLVALGLELTGEVSAAILAALFSVCVLIAPLVDGFNGLLVRRGRVRTFAAASIVAELLAFVVAAVSLINGFGVYALAFGKIVFLASCAGLLAWQSGWTGGLTLKGPRTRLLLSTSAHILANRSIFFVQRNTATFLVGAFLGPTGVGFFRAAERVVSSVAELVMEPLRMIAWVELRKVADQAGESDPDLRLKLANAATNILPLFVFLTAPVFIGLAFVAHDVVIFALGPTWAPSGDVAMIFALAACSVVPGVLAEPLLSLTGEIRRLPRIMLLNAGFGAVMMMMLGPFGLYALASVAIPTGLFTIATTLWILWRHGGFKWRPALKGASLAVPPLCAMALAVFGSQWITSQLSMSLLVSLGLQVVSGAIAYLGVLHLLRPEALLALRRL